MDVQISKEQLDSLKTRNKRIITFIKKELLGLGGGSFKIGCNKRDLSNFN